MPQNVDRVAIEDYDESEELLENIQNGTNRSTCASLILKVNEYNKKPQIEYDLSGILNNYLGILHESDVFFENGIFKTNFAEAALLLQGSVQLYGKKVDLFWDFVVDYLNRNMSYEEKTEENKDEFDLLEERKGKFKRKRKILEENEEEPVQKGSRKAFIIDKSSANIQGMCFDEFQQYLATGTSSNENSPNTSYEENWQEKSKVSSSSILDNKLRYGKILPTSIISFENQLSSNTNSIITHSQAGLQYDVTELNIYGEKEPMGDYGSSSAFDQIHRENSSLHRQVHQHNIPDAQVERSDVQDMVLQRWLTEKSMRIDQVYGMWEEFIAECKRVEQGLYKLQQSDGKSSYYFAQPSTSTHVEQDENAAENSAFDSLIASDREQSQESVMAEITALNEINKELGALMEKRNGSIRKTMDSDIESGVFDTLSTSTGATPKKVAEGDRPLSVISEGLCLDYPMSPDATGQDCRAATPINMPNLDCLTSLPLLNETIVEEVKKDECQVVKKARKKLILEELDEEGNPIIKPKRSRRIKERLRPIITVDMKKFNRFFLQHYTPEDGEGELEPFEDDDDDDDEVLGDLQFFNASTDLDEADLITSTPKAKPCGVESNNASIEATPTDKEAAAEKSFADIMCNDAAKRLKHVLDWRKFIMEKISKTKTEFDIHVEETHLIESIGEVGKSAKYKDLCAGKTSAEVSHNFIAMLHLVNTHNVDVSGVRPGKLSDESLEIKLLSTERHHEHLDEYNAPSVDSFEEKMDCVKKALKRQKSLGGANKSSKKMKMH